MANGENGAGADPIVTAINPFLQTLNYREFRLFWIASGISLTGDQLTFIALPWLVLKLTNDPLIMGTVLAVAAVPRAVFMLVGGVATDRYSPRIVMLVSNLVRMLLMLLLAVLTWQGSVAIWMIYGIAVLFGLADAFMFPAASAFPPRLLPPERLAAGNSLFQGTAQLSLIVGPLLAGGLIVTFGGGQEPGGLSDARGLALVFLLDTLTFIVPLLILLVIRDRFPPPPPVPQSMWANLMEGLRHAWDDVPVRTFALLIAGLGLFFRGPFMVGIPAFANATLPEGAAAFGIIMSALGVGAIVGTVLAGTTRHPAPHWLGAWLLIDFFCFGLIFLAMPWLADTYLIASIVLLAAIVDGYIIVLLITWTQQRVPAAKLGRVMSIIMLASQGLYPISAALAGMFAGWDLDAMLLGAGAVMLGITLFGMSVRVVRRMGYD